MITVIRRQWLIIFVVIALLVLGCYLFIVQPSTLFTSAQGGDPMPCYDVPIGDSWWHFCGIEITNTPVPVVTFEPTQEIPTITPTPASTQPPLKVCTLRSVTVINVRSGPGTNYGIRDKWQQGIEREFVKFNDEDRDYLWGYSEDGIGGWTAVYDKAALSWFVAGTQGAALCVDVDGWPDGLVPSEPFATNAALMWHAVPGANDWEMGVSYGVLQSKDIDFGVKSYADFNLCINALELGGVCIWRHGSPDCPSGVGVENPVESARSFIEWDTWAAGTLALYDKAYIEPTNECWYGDDNHPEIYVWWAEWLSVYIDEARARGFPKLVIPTLGVANASELQMQAWKTVLQRSADNGNLFGEHIYTPYHDEGLCSCDEWLACRHRKDQQIRLEMGLDIRVAITEVARGWGNDPVDVSDFVCWYEIVRHDGWVHSVSLWTAGYNGTWPNAQLDDHMVEIVKLVSAE